MVERKQELLPYLSTGSEGVSGNTIHVNPIRENLLSSWVATLVAIKDLANVAKILIN